MYTVPQVPHLRDVDIRVEYRECYYEEPSEGAGPPKIVRKPDRWRGDPDRERYSWRRPKAKHWVNGVVVREQLPTPLVTSSTPFPHTPVPRRGLIAVSPGEHDYLRLCYEQGITPIVSDQTSAALLNGVSHPYVEGASAASHSKTNGINGGSSTVSDDHDDHMKSNSDESTSHATNGINGDMHSSGQ